MPERAWCLVLPLALCAACATPPEGPAAAEAGPFETVVAHIRAGAPDSVAVIVDPQRLRPGRGLPDGRLEEGVDPVVDARLAVLAKLGVPAVSMAPRRRCWGRYLPESMKELSECPDSTIIHLILARSRADHGVPPDDPRSVAYYDAERIVRFMRTDYSPLGSSASVDDAILVRDSVGAWKVTRLVNIVVID